MLGIYEMRKEGRKAGRHPMKIMGINKVSGRVNGVSFKLRVADQ